MANKTAFSQTLRKLREDKKISQKSVSQDLGISQALLSHYEKGVRECGLSFLIKAAKYYGVTTDYLLGLALQADTEEYENIDEQPEEIQEKQKNKRRVENNYAILCKNLIINVIDYIFSNMKDIEYKQTAKISGEYMILSVYSLYKYLSGASDGDLSSYDELEAAKSNLIVKLKKNKYYLKESHTYHLSNEYINSIIKNGDNIISRINFV